MPGPLPPSSTADKLVAGATYAFNTGVVAGAPALNSLVPGSNPTGAGGIEVSLLGDGITTVIQALKAHDWFLQNKWAVWVCIALAIALCVLLWHDDLRHAVLNACGAAFKAASNYSPLRQLGVLGPGTDGGANG